jgi:hypothetical protein
MEMALNGARFMRIAHAFALCIMSLVVAPAVRATPSFQFLGDLPGGAVYSHPRGTSFDASYIVGDSSSTNSGTNVNSRLEAFLWDEATGTMLGLGSLLGAGGFNSSAAGVSDNGNVVVGYSQTSTFVTTFGPRLDPFRWTRSGGMVKVGNVDIPNTHGLIAATAVTTDGSKLCGLVISTDSDFSPRNPFDRGFTWSVGAADVTFLNDMPAQSSANAMNRAGTAIVGLVSSSGAPTNLFRKIGAGGLEDLGVFGTSLVPAGVSADGKTIVGQYTHDGSVIGSFIWTEGGNPKFKELNPTGGGTVGISSSGRVVAERTGGLYLDQAGPIDIREILANAGVVDLRSLSAPSTFEVSGLSANGMVVIGSLIDGDRKAWRVRLTDCDGNGLPDELERGAAFSGSDQFASSRESLGYQDMIAHYGKPWKPGTFRTPQRNLDQPAEYLRALMTLPGCLDDASINTADEANRFFLGAALPAAHELHEFEMLLGNEALADALDPTVGVDGIATADLGNQFAFRGLRGIDDLLDEELALLRGRDLPGSPSSWLTDETTYYPEFTATNGVDKVRAAIYNRLPPNATGANGLAYRSNYSVVDNYQAALRYPQGHGDAYGHYLTAMRSVIQLLSTGVSGIPDALMNGVLFTFANDDEALKVVEDLGAAAVARVEAAGDVADLLYRRDYKEDPQHPAAAALFADSDTDRAWSMGDWVRKGAVGAYLDWALVAHLAPTDAARPVNRDGIPELEELPGAVAALQERLDTAGAGLDPLGLVQNVVPFGIESTGLEPGSGHSHYEQVRDAASKALDNARKAFENANQADQRLRDSDRTLQEFTDRLEDTQADTDQQLIEIYGLPSPDDPADNDLDPSTTDFDESQSHPDLTNYLAIDEVLALQGLRPRQAPGEVQIALSEIKVAALRVREAELAIDDNVQKQREQLDRIKLIMDIEQERLQIIADACNDQIDLQDRLKAIDDRNKAFGFFSNGISALVTGNPGPLINSFLDVGASIAGADNQFDVEKERIRIQCYKDIKIQGLEDKLQLSTERDALKDLIRKQPQLIVDRSIQTELATQAIGRLRQAIAKGELILKKKLRLESRTEGQLLEQRWKDMAFRVVRNAALKNYRAFFDLAARYVVLAARAYSYEFDSRSDGENFLSGIYKERRLGDAVGLGGGLQGVLSRIDANVTVNNFNRPLETLGERTFSFRRNLLGVGVQDFPNDDLRFRAWLEGQIVDRLEDLNEVTEIAQLSQQRDFGPAIVIPFSTEIDGRNFFGQGPEQPFGNTNFSITRNAKIRSFAIRLDGVDTGVGIDPQQGTVFVYLLPAGDSVLRENNNRPIIEDEPAVPWAVVDQFLPPPPSVVLGDLARRSYSPWRSTAQVGGNFLNTIKRQRDSEAQVELGQQPRLNTNLAGRSAWNTRWILIIPGSQWTSSSDPAEIRQKLRQVIYGIQADPTNHVGITDIRWIIQAYSH